MAVVQQPVQHRRHCSAVAQQLSPVVDWPVGRQKCTGSLVSAHDDFQQLLGGRERQLLHAKIVDDKQGYRGKQFHVFFSFAVQRGVGEFFQQDVRFAIDHTIALLDDGVTDGLGQVTFTAAGGPRNMMHITLGWQQFTTVGIRFMGSRCESSSG